jgi:hypothetical protein
VNAVKSAGDAAKSAGDAAFKAGKGENPAFKCLGACGGFAGGFADEGDDANPLR